MSQSMRVSKHLPLHFKEMYPKFVAFVELYYDFMNSSDVMNEVFRGRVQSGDTGLIRDDSDLFIATLDERLSGIRQEQGDIEVSDWRAPSWWTDNMMSILNMERIPESLFVSNDEVLTTKEGEVFETNFVFKRAVENWMKDSGFPEASVFGGDVILTSRILRSLYQLKGTTKALELFFNVFYGENVNIINPNNLIACIDDNFALDSNVQIKDDLSFSEYSIIVQTLHDKEYYEPLFTDVYLKMFHPAGFGISFSESKPVDPDVIVPTLELSLNKPYWIGVTNNGVVNVKGVQGGNTWEYTTDYGVNYSKGYGSSFKLLSGNYSSGRVGARQKTPDGRYSEISFIGDVLVELEKPPITIETDYEYKRIKGKTLPRVEVYLKTYDGRVIDKTKSDSLGIYRFLFKTGIPIGEYVAEVFSVAGNVSTVTLDVNYLDVELTVPTLSLAKDSGSSATDFISNDGQINVTNLDGNAWEYSFDGGATWNDGQGESFRLKHGTYPINSVMARTKYDKFHSKTGVLNKQVRIVLLKPKINISLNVDELIIESKDVTTVSIFKNGSYIMTSGLTNNVLKFKIELVDWDHYIVKSVDIAGNEALAEYTIQII